MNTITQNTATNLPTALDQRDIGKEVQDSLTRAFDQLVITGADTLVLGAELTELSARGANVTVTGSTLVVRMGNRGLEKVQEKIKDADLDDLFAAAPTVADAKATIEKVVADVKAK